MNGKNKPRVEGTGLALAGGGFRAALFHLGSLWRINELGMLKDLSEVTGVSGGSITAAYLGYKWKNLKFDNDDKALNFQDEIVTPLRAFCITSIDIRAFLKGFVTPGFHPSHFLTHHFRKHLFGGDDLQTLPTDKEGPRITIYATNLQTGVSFRFSQPYMGDYKIGKVNEPKIPLAKVVAASNAFPPFLSPLIIRTNPKDWEPWNIGGDLFYNHRYRRRLFLGDGGIYDNLGLERIWDKYTTVIVSDSGAPFKDKPFPVMQYVDYISRSVRVFSIITEQTRALRRKKMIDFYKYEGVMGTMWCIDTDISKYYRKDLGIMKPLKTDAKITQSVSEYGSKLRKFSDIEQGRLINWGYALADAAIRRRMKHINDTERALPIPEFPLSE